MFHQSGGSNFLSLLIAFVAVSGVIYIGSQSKFIPYIVEVNKLGETIVVGRTQVGTIKYVSSVWRFKLFISIFLDMFLPNLKGLVLQSQA